MTLTASLIDPLWTLAQGFGLQQQGGAGGGLGGGEGGEALWLVSPWKPIVALVFFLGWAWVVATIYDKDAARWFLPRKAWNLGHVVAGVVAFALVLLVPVFWIGLPAMALVLGLDLGVYALARNRDHRVPDSQHWTLDFEKMKRARAERQTVKSRGQVTLELRGPKGLVPPPAKESPEYEVRLAGEKLLLDAIDARASRIDVAPGTNGAYVAAFLVDGVRQNRDAMQPANAFAVIDFFKAASGLDVNDRRRRLRADIAMEQGGARRKLRIITSGGAAGLRLSILVDPESQVKFKLEELGLLEGQRKELEAIVKERQGAVLVAAPPQGGRTATLYTLLRAHDPYTSNVQTIELEPSDTIEGVRHNVFNPMADGAEYSTTVRSILRRDPDVVAIAELPDPATAVEVTRADHERTRTYVGLRADNSLVAIQTFMKAAGDSEAAANALHGVIAQKLLRKLCLNCRVEYPPSPELLRKLGVPAEKVSKLFKKGGQVLIKNKPEVCPVCQGVGYFGQEGVFEVFRLDADERKLIASNDLAGLRAALRKKRLPSIQDAALAKAVQGVTSVEEVVRVTGGQQSAPAKPPAAPAATPPGRPASGPPAQ